MLITFTGTEIPPYPCSRHHDILIPIETTTIPSFRAAAGLGRQLDEKDLEDSLLDDASSEEEVIDAKRPTSLSKGAPLG